MSLENSIDWQAEADAFSGGEHDFKLLTTLVILLSFTPEVTSSHVHHQSGSALPNVIMSMLHVTATLLPSVTAITIH